MHITADSVELDSGDYPAKVVEEITNVVLYRQAKTDWSFGRWPTWRSSSQPIRELTLYFPLGRRLFDTVVVDGMFPPPHVVCIADLYRRSICSIALI